MCKSQLSCLYIQQKIIVYYIYKVVSFLLVSLFDIFVKAVWGDEEM